jgi:hypothetical protein
MNGSTAEIDEIESARQEYLEEFKADEEPCEEFVAGSYGCHELLDRTSVLMSNVDEYILGHPACVNNKEWFALAYKAVDLLNELYQKIGAEHLEKTTGHKQLTTDN